MLVDFCLTNLLLLSHFAAKCEGPVLVIMVWPLSHFSFLLQSQLLITTVIKPYKLLDTYIRMHKKVRQQYGTVTKQKYLQLVCVTELSPHCGSKTQQSHYSVYHSIEKNTNKSIAKLYTMLIVISQTYIIKINTNTYFYSVFLFFGYDFTPSFFFAASNLFPK